MSETALKSEDVKAATAAKTNGAAEHDDLSAHKESTFMYIVRYIPRACFRTLQWMGKEESPFLGSVMTPVDTETFSESLNVVEGAVPPELSGYFLRTGPNPQHKPWGGYHWFDGDAMVHAIRFGGGQAMSYSNRWLRTKRFLMEKAAGCNLLMRFGDMKGFLGLFLMIFSKMFHSLLVPAKQDQLVNGQLGNTALQWHNGKLLALMEGGYPFLVKLCAGVVKSVSEFTFGGSLEHSFTAHPKIDPRTGEMVSFSYGIDKPVKGTDAWVGYFSVTPSGSKGKTHPVDVLSPQMMHDFSITENYAIFMDHALIFDPKTMITEKSLPFKSELSRPSRLGLLKRSAPEEGVKWFETDPFVILHTGAAWEDGSKVHFIGCRYERLDLGGKLDEGGNPPADPTRYTIDVATGEVTRTCLFEGYDLDFPVLPAHLVTRAAKYTYMSGNKARSRVNGVKMNRIVKVSNTAEEGKGLVGEISLPEGYCGGEFSIAPRNPPSTAGEHAEDDGWLVGFVTDEKSMQSYCLVYDAQTMSEVPVAKVAMPQRVPLGFHGAWLPTEVVKSKAG